MLYLEDGPGYFVEWRGEPLDDVRHPLNIEQLWSADELADINLYVPVDPDIPAGKRVVSQTVQRVNGIVTFVHVLGDEPGSVDAQFPPMPMWQFWSIIDLSGVGEQALYDAIDMIPDAAFKVKAKRKLANPPGGVFRRSDPLFSNPFLMMQLSLAKDQIDALWAQGLALE